MKYGTLAAGLVLSAVAAQHAQAGLIKNGGFEEDLAGTHWVFQEGQPQAVLSDESAFAHTAENGTNYVYSNNGTVSQALTDDASDPITLQAGVTYTLSGQVGFPAYWEEWQLSLYGNPGRSLRLLVVDDSDAEVHLIAVSPEWFTGIDQAGQWFDISGEFTADESNPYIGKQLVVQFYTAGPQASWDNIELTAVPEPASLGALGLGAMMLLARRR